MYFGKKCHLHRSKELLDPLLQGRSLLSLLNKSLVLLIKGKKMSVILAFLCENDLLVVFLSLWPCSCCTEERYANSLETSQRSRRETESIRFFYQ